MTTTRERIQAALARHRAEQNGGAQPVPAKQPSPRPGAKPQRPIERFEPIVVACGHVGAFPIYADADKYRNERRLKYRTRVRCPSCTLEMEKRQVRISTCSVCKEKGQLFRLPDGATFTAVYDAQSRTWNGTLTVEMEVYRLSRPGLAHLERDLGGLWQEHQAEAAAELD